MRFGLKESTIDQINTVFAQFPQVESAILYGSRAKGNYKPGSDIDLTLTGDKVDLSLIHKMELKLDDLLLPYTIELSAYRHISNPDLVDHIDRVGKLFYRAA
jgi:predicted nucleotidyltransferase